MEIESNITQVTVYADRSLVTRTAEVSLAAGENLLLVKPLPAEIDPESVQVKGQGAASLKSVEVRTVHLTETAHDRKRQAEATRRAVLDRKRAGEDKVRQIEAERKLIEGIAAKITTPGEKGAPQGELDPAKWIEMVTFYRTRHAALDAEKSQLEKELETIERELAKAKRELSDISGRHYRGQYEVEFILEATKAGSVRVAVSYIVQGASWQPVYELRASGESQTLQVGYHALVRQSTSEDWKAVKVSLSTARPEAGAKHPELTPWHIGQIKRKQYEDILKAPAPIIMKETAEGDAPGTEVPLEMAELELPEAEVRTMPTSAVFDIAAVHDIPSDNRDHRVSILVKDFPAFFRYSTVPKLAPLAYLKARVTNDTDLPFLPGPTHVFLDNSFVANGLMELVPQTAEFWTFLGVDDGIKVEYKVLGPKQKSGGLIGNRTVLRYDYLIEVTNRKKRAEEVAVWDQLPISSHQEIKVELEEPRIRAEDERVKRNEYDYVEWLVKPEPGEKLKIPFRFTVSHPKGMAIK